VSAANRITRVQKIWSEKGKLIPDVQTDFYFL